MGVFWIVPQGCIRKTSLLNNSTYVFTCLFIPDAVQIQSIQYQQALYIMSWLILMFFVWALVRYFITV